MRMSRAQWEARHLRNDGVQGSYRLQVPADRLLLPVCDKNVLTLKLRTIGLLEDYRWGAGHGESDWNRFAELESRQSKKGIFPYGLA